MLKTDGFQEILKSFCTNIIASPSTIHGVLSTSLNKRKPKIFIQKVYLREKQLYLKQTVRLSGCLYDTV